MKYFYPSLLVILLLSGCSAYKDSAKYDFKDEFYKVKTKHANYPIFVHNTGDTIKLYSITPSNDIYKIDTSANKTALLPATSSSPIEKHLFQHNGFDIDFLTIICKYRPVSKSFPNQFNTNLNGAVYTGYRKDLYSIHYKQNRLGYYNQKITHYGISLGGFAGLGGTAINEWTTLPSLDKEYDGVVLAKGFATVVGIDKLTFGLAIGWDNLLDKFHRQWIYQNKSWYGITLGLNIN